jgi:hypothetical protein
LAEKTYALKPDWNATMSPTLPHIGIGRSSEYKSLSPEEVEKIKLCKFSHYRVEIDLHSTVWKTALKQAALEARNLELGLEIALIIDEKSSEIAFFLDEAGRIHHQIKSVVLFFQPK